MNDSSKWEHVLASPKQAINRVVSLTSEHSELVINAGSSRSRHLYHSSSITLDELLQPNYKASSLVLNR
jgi:hypothetical protein